MVNSWSLFPRVETSSTRRDSLKARGGKFRGGARGKFSQGVVGASNAQPVKLMEAGMFPMFKVYLDRNTNGRRTEE